MSEVNNFDLEGYDGEFRPESKFGLRLEDIPDGQYTIQCLSASLDKSSSGMVLCKAELEIQDGPRQGDRFEHVWYLKDQATANDFGKDLFKLGFDSNTWNEGHNKKFSVEIVKALPLIVNRRFLATKKSSKDTKKDKVYHNLVIMKRLEDGQPKEPEKEPWD